MRSWASDWTRAASPRVQFSGNPNSAPKAKTFRDTRMHYQTAGLSVKHNTVYLTLRGGGREGEREERRRERGREGEREREREGRRVKIGRAHV